MMNVSEHVKKIKKIKEKKIRKLWENICVNLTLI